MFVRFLIYGCTFLFSTCIFTQRTFSFGPSYHIPFGDLSEFYNPAPGFDISFLEVDEDERWPFDFGIGITRFQPKQEGFDIQLVQGQSNVVVSNYWFLPLWVSIGHSFEVGKSLKPYVGAGIGYYYHHMTIELESPGQATSDGSAGTKYGVFPRAGFTKRLNDRAVLYFDCRLNYTLSPEGGENLIPGKELGNTDNYLSLGLGLAYKTKKQ